MRGGGGGGVAERSASESEGAEHRDYARCIRGDRWGVVLSLKIPNFANVRLAMVAPDVINLSW